MSKSLHARYLEAGIMELYWDTGLDSFQGDVNAMGVTKKYITKLSEMLADGTGIIYVGTNGNGKTYLAIEILKAAVVAKYTARFTSLGGLIQKFTEGWYSLDERHRFEEDVRNVQFLLIDDIGKEYKAKSGMATVVFDNVLRYRVMRKLPTLITTNMRPEEIEHDYGVSVRSLLAGCCYPLLVKGVCYRTTSLQSKIKEKLSV